MRATFLLLLCSLAASPAFAGKNANGTLIVHTNDANGYTANICSRFETVDSPGECLEAGTQTNKPEDQPALVWLIAHFCPQSNPGVTVIYFGLNHNLPPGLGYFANFGLCGPAGSIEVPDAGWPDQGGNSVAFGSVVAGDVFFPFYYLNAYGFAGAFLGTGINPTGGYAAFVDDSNPPVQDNITNFGLARWGEPGLNSCCGGPPDDGACCFPDGSCIITPPAQCAGDYQGDQTVCNPNPCPRPEACCFADCHCEDLLVSVCVAQGGSPKGAGTVCATTECECPPPIGPCCFADGSCEVVLEVDCDAMGGTYQGDGTNCDQVQCPPVATESTTWGRIKAGYR